jgi:SAM-dependent methyltransferase
MSFRCRACNSGDLYFYYGEGNNQQYKYYKCPVCGLVNYDLSLGLDQEQYAEEYIDPRDSQNKVNRYQRQTCEFISRHIYEPGTVLEIGCGNGGLLDCLRTSGWGVKGLELSPLLANSIKEKLNIDVELENFMDYSPTQENLYDLVILRHVFEHLPNPILVLNKLSTLVKEGGYIEMEFPNIEAPELKLKRFFWRLGFRIRKPDRDRAPGHANEFSRKSFQYLLDKTGFKLVKWETYTLKPVSNFIYKYVSMGSKARVLIKKQL